MAFFNAKENSCGDAPYREVWRKGLDPSFTSPLFFGHCPKGGATMRASKRNLDKLVQVNSYTWTLNGMKYRKVEACKRCGKPFFRYINSDYEFCNHSCERHYRPPAEKKDPPRFSDRIRLNAIKRMKGGGQHENMLGQP